MTASTSLPARAEQLAYLTEAVSAAAALAAADRLGILGRLERGPADPQTLARDCSIGERGAGLLLAALAAFGAVESGEDGSYRPAMPRLGKLGRLITIWEALAEAVREDRSPIAGDTPAGAEEFYQEATPYLGLLFASAAEQAAGRLASSGWRVLDLGAGAAPWSIALARRDPGCHVTAVDLPAVLAATRQAAASAGVEGNFEYRGGDFFTVDLGKAAYDLAIAGNVCHLFDEAANRRLLSRLYGALRPGGRVAIFDALPNERLDGPREVVLYALGLMIRTSSGQVYPFSTYLGWLHEAGYERVERIDLLSRTPVSLITARRPGPDGDLRSYGDAGDGRAAPPRSGRENPG